MSSPENRVNFMTPEQIKAVKEASLKRLTEATTPQEIREAITEYLTQPGQELTAGWTPTDPDSEMPAVRERVIEILKADLGKAN